jgi:hypothetical protein
MSYVNMILALGRCRGLAQSREMFHFGWGVGIVSVHPFCGGTYLIV